LNRIGLSKGLLIVSLLLFISCSKNKSTESNNPTVPVLTTTAVSAISETTAQSGGNITSDGGANVFYRGVCWSTHPTPTYADSRTYDSTGTGAFVSLLAGLTAGTHYYVRAYAMNDVGVGYGNIDTFTTDDGSTTGTVTDIDGNVYATVKIGSQWWMAENLKVTHYRNGSDIQRVADSSAWQALVTGAYCHYNNDSANATAYGRLYNWYAVNDNRNIAPAGWHVPTDIEWKQLEMFLGMSQSEADTIDWRGTDEGGKLKENGTTHWNSPNTGATNESGFSALPGGFRGSNSIYEGIGGDAVFWSATQSVGGYAWYRYLYYYSSRTYRQNDQIYYGFSIRCIRN
jgi:uncharacterized protein (TIGR02145 family)